MKLSSYKTNKAVWYYIIKFSLVFCFFYFGSLAVIGVSSPEGYYNAFIADNLNYIDWLRFSLLHSSKILLALLGYHSHLRDKYILVMENVSAIKMVYTCIGYGIMSFWAAFIIANTGAWKTKIKWTLFGWLMIWTVNVARISILLILLGKNQSITMPLPVNFDNHTWFNIVVYILIFVLIYFYHRAQQKSEKHLIHPVTVKKKDSL